MAMSKEEKREYMREYYKKHKKERRESMKKYEKKYEEKLKGYRKKYNKEHREKTRFYNSKTLSKIFSNYYHLKYSRFISLHGYFTILKSPDLHLKISIMAKLGKGTIDEEEAIRLSGQTLTKEDLDLINSYDYKTIKKEIS